MMNLMHKRLNKKGFTLAELLIVVAIIAILVAIAVPIFTSSLREAQLRTNQANVRAAKSAGVNYIMTKWNDEKNPMSGGAAEGKGWKVTAKVNANGDITSVTAEVEDENKTEAIIKPETGDEQYVSNSAGLAPAYTIVLHLTDVDMTKTS